MMQKQLFPLKIGALDTKTDPRQMPPGSLILSENVLRDKACALVKRFGATALDSIDNGSGYAVSPGRLAPFRDEMLAFRPGGDITVESYSSTRAAWLYEGTYPSVMPKVTGLYASTSTQSCADAAVSGTTQLAAWEDTSAAGSVVWIMSDLATGTILAQDTIAVAAAKPKVVSIGASFLIFYADGANLKVRRIVVATGAVASTTTIATDLHANHSFDVLVQLPTFPTFVAFAYHSTAPSVKAGEWNGSTDSVLGSITAPVAGALADRCMGWLAQDYGATAYLGIADSANGVRVLAIDTLDLNTGTSETRDAASTDVRNITGHFNGTTATLLYEVTAATTYNTFIKTSSAAATSSVAWRGEGLASKAFKVPGAGASTPSPYAVVTTYDSPTQRCYFVRHTNKQDPAAQMLYGNGVGLTAKRSALSHVTAYGSTSMVCASLRANLLETLSGRFQTLSGPVLFTLDFGEASLPRPQELGSLCYLNGGVMRTYDPQGGASFSAAIDVVPALAPEALTLTPGTTGSLDQLGTYKYVALYLSVDRQGRVRQGPVSAVASVTLTGVQDSIDVAIPTLRATGQTYKIRLYRTVNGGGNFYRVDSGINNDRTVDTVTFSDTVTDAQLEAGETLYTDSGELDNFAPPALKSIAVYGNRVWGIDAEDDRKLRPSKELQPGVGIGWHPSLEVKIEGDGGGATALLTMDDKLLVFKRQAIYAVTGDGPDNRGVGQQWPRPMLVTNAVGTIEPESVVLTPDGAMFKSLKGIYLLTRGLELKYLGAAVDAYNGEDVTGVVHLETESQVRFFTASGRTLVWDYFFAEWFTFTNQAAQSAVLWSGRPVYLKTDGTVLQESTAWSDNGTAITMALELAPIAIAGLGGYQRVWEIRLAGDYFASSTFTAKVAYDYGSTNAETLALALAGIAVDSTYRARGKLARRKCEALRLRLEESSTGQGFSFTGLAIQAGGEPGKGGRIKAANALG